MLNKEQLVEQILQQIPQQIVPVKQLKFVTRRTDDLLPA